MPVAGLQGEALHGLHPCQGDLLARGLGGAEQRVKHVSSLGPSHVHLVTKLPHVAQAEQPHPGLAQPRLHTAGELEAGHLGHQPPQQGEAARPLHVDHRPVRGHVLDPAQRSE